MTAKIVNIQREWSLKSLTPGSYSFLNLASISTILDADSDRYINIEFYCDGGLLSTLITILTGSKVDRVSFDFTSIADEVFVYCQHANKSLYFVGAEAHEISNFISKIKKIYPQLNISGYHHGFMNNPINLAKEISLLSPDFVIVGMGAGKQEQFMLTLLSQSFSGIGFTCGGFIRQFSTAKNGMYYPDWINKLKLRSFYRMYKEPHTIKRYLFDYPYNLFLLIYGNTVKKITFKVI